MDSRGGWALADVRPFLFYRYELTVDDELLDAKAQLNALKELQGQFYPSSPSAERGGLFDSVIMRPRSLTLDDGRGIVPLDVEIGEAALLALSR
jgi:hypothetical protein